ncbi:MAG: 4-hydroxy-tetrahydrodipicolinate reductase [Deltaproteobacteria bacterium]|nr:4-hydroxy-tetrahydrodipicolinate reductase [Deltaproteobacteria bacterium]
MTEVKIALVGAAGRMGKEIIKAATANPAAAIGAAVEYNGCPVLGQDAGVLAGVGPLNVLLTADLAGAAKDCDVILDVSLPEATPSIIETAVQLHKPLVSGITGATDAILKQIAEAAAHIPVLHSKNFSVGIAVLSALVKQAAAILGTDYDIEIFEKHHNQKVDAPSGTAQILADAMLDSISDGNCVYGREGNTGRRPKGEIGIHALRGGGIFGEHTVYFIGQNERLELGHVAHTRALFAEGAVKTAVFIARAKVGQHTMSDVLGLN